MMNFYGKLKSSKPVDAVRKFISSEFFPFLTAAVVMGCYFMGWDLVSIYFLGLTGAFILLFHDDLTPLIANVVFMNVIISEQNSPSPDGPTGASDYFFRPDVLAQAGIVVAIAGCALIFRLVLMFRQKRFKPTPMLYGFCGLCAAFLLNGLFIKEYDPLNFVYGLLLTFFFLIAFLLFKDNLKISGKNFKYIAWTFVALSALLIIELIEEYLTVENLFVDGVINRGKILFGWGVYNIYGMLIVLCIPPVLYLAGKYKYGFVLTIYSAFVVLASLACTSRQAMICSAVLYPVCIIILLIKGKNKNANFAAVGGLLLICAVITGVFSEFIYVNVKKIFDNVFIDGALNGSGRWRLWKAGWNAFISAPVFGRGFFDLTDGRNASGLGIIPIMYHNTFIELLAACGFVGFAAYGVHRAQTVLSYFKRITVDRTFIVLTISALLMTSLLDNHIFYLIPSCFYTILVSVLVGSEKEHKTMLKYA